MDKRQPANPLRPGPLVNTLPAALADLAGPDGLLHLLAATRMLLGAWDATLSRGDAAGSVAPARPAMPPSMPDWPPAPAQTLPLPATDAHAHANADTHAQAALTVQMLDGLQLWVDATLAPTLPHGKARSVLVYLLLHRRRPVPRARLCQLFWPDADPAAARNNLHVNLHRVRRQLGDPHLLHHGDEGYQITTAGDTWLDVEQFEAQARQGEQADLAGTPLQAIAHYEIAAALYRSDLVEEGEREPVLIAESQALRDRLNLVLERLSDLREVQGDLHGCVRASQRHLALDECNETAHRRVMRCYARLGQPQLAERQWRTCERALVRRLGLAPDDETRALMRRIGARQPV
ncbi:AfsR/SARP family transcriptional regulator [Sphaerotilus sp.]|jgi:DNA-binding SARP family transcriptional activator|uniref:AfsR/SARP family transcriptional regulator n=1 Tax=Sphaerotilus sp. TaxID=2093942 RepID=UPI0025D0BD60|nr:BTAD domain-containing putative transcriptional regulator [Sphaerotilus sp.]